ncbi:MAG: phosphoesterase [bacterium]|nr:phosphoesterase [bacterium]
MNKQYDIIGDIHGHAQRLEALLETLGYERPNGSWSHGERTALFVGDLVDRGPENFRALELVKAMVDNGSAEIVMGNHEYNALCFHTRDREGRFLRRHSGKNIHQHEAVLKEIDAGGEESRAMWEEYLEWFRRMPFFLEINGVRVVHACWDQWGVEFVKRNAIRDHGGRLTDEFLEQSARYGSDAFDMVEVLLKGEEVPLPSNHPGIRCMDGAIRKRLRLKWWLPGHHWEEMTTYQQVVRADPETLQGMDELEIPADILTGIREKWGNAGMEQNNGCIPVFIGHYWFTGEPELLSNCVACLDYSVARGGKLVCYRWDGESFLDRSKFVAV